MQVPPYFLNTSLQSDATLTVKEYTDVSLPCKAAANPVPVVTWRREDGQEIPAKIPAKGTLFDKHALLLMTPSNCIVITQR